MIDMSCWQVGFSFLCFVITKGMTISGLWGFCFSLVLVVLEAESRVFHLFDNPSSTELYPQLSSHSLIEAWSH